MAFEGAVGVVLVFDLLISFFQLAFGVSGGGQRPSWYSGLFKLVDVRLYLHHYAVDSVPSTLNWQRKSTGWLETCACSTVAGGIQVGTFDDLV